MARARRGARTGGSARPGWLAAGVAVGIVLAPAAAVAAGVSVTSLVGPNGTKAAVARTGQLLTAPADPSTVRQFFAGASGGGTSSGCVNAFTAPKGSSFVLTQVAVDTWEDSTPGTGNDAAVFLSSAKAQCEDPIGDVNPPGLGELTLPFSPGIVVPAGDSITVESFQNVAAEFFGEGYLVPSADAPHPTLVPRGLGASWAAQHRSERRGATPSGS